MRTEVKVAVNAAIKEYAYVGYGNIVSSKGWILKFPDQTQGTRKEENY
jgi:hypothetical protein